MIFIGPWPWRWSWSTSWSNRKENMSDVKDRKHVLKIFVCELFYLLIMSIIIWHFLISYHIISYCDIIIIFNIQFVIHQPDIISNVVIEFSNMNKCKQFLDEQMKAILRWKKCYRITIAKDIHDIKTKLQAFSSKHSPSTRRTSQLWIRMGKQ